MDNCCQTPVPREGPLAPKLGKNYEIPIFFHLFYFHSPYRAYASILILFSMIHSMSLCSKSFQVVTRLSVTRRDHGEHLRRFFYFSFECLVRASYRICNDAKVVEWSDAAMFIGSAAKFNAVVMSQNWSIGCVAFVKINKTWLSTSPLEDKNQCWKSDVSTDQQLAIRFQHVGRWSIALRAYHRLFSDLVKSSLTLRTYVQDMLTMSSFVSAKT